MATYSYALPRGATLITSKVAPPSEKIIRQSPTRRRAIPGSPLSAFTLLARLAGSAACYSILERIALAWFAGMRVNILNACLL
jgi:hypothetical protein